MCCFTVSLNVSDGGNSPGVMVKKTVVDSASIIANMNLKYSKLDWFGLIYIDWFLQTIRVTIL